MALEWLWKGPSQAPTGIVCIVPVHSQSGRGMQRVTAVLGKVPSTDPLSSWLQSIVAG